MPPTCAGLLVTRRITREGKRSKASEEALDRERALDSIPKWIEVDFRVGTCCISRGYFSTYDRGGSMRSLAGEEGEGRGEAEELEGNRRRVARGRATLNCSS